MRRFGHDQITSNFSPHGGSQPPAPPRRPGLDPWRVTSAEMPYVSRAEPLAHQQENVAPAQGTFGSISYGLDAANQMATGNPSAEPFTPWMGGPYPPASLANMTLGTTFAAKARAAELNAVRNHRAKAQESEDKNNENETSMAQASSTSTGALRLTKPGTRTRTRTRSKSWKPLDLGDIPESSSEVSRPETQSHHPSTSTKTSTPINSNLQSSATALGAQSSSQVSYPLSQRLQSHTGHGQQFPSYISDAQEPVTAVPRLTNEMAPRSAFVSPEHVRQQMYQSNQVASEQQQHIPRYYDSLAASTQYQRSVQRQSELSVQRQNELSAQKTKARQDDPFIDISASLRQSAHRQTSQPDDRSVLSAHGISPDGQGKMDYEFKFPTQQQQQHRAALPLPPPPGLPRPTVQPQALHDTFSSIAADSSAPTADTHRRDPKPYTSYARVSDDGSKKEKLLQNLQQVVDVSKAQGSVPSSTRTVLYDPVAQGSSAAAARPRQRQLSSSANDNLKGSEPLPWKDRPVDIYSMPPPTPVVQKDDAHEPAAAAANETQQGAMDGNEYIRSLLIKRESAEQRLKNSETWWSHDGRGQDQVRAYLDQVTEQHKQHQSTPEYHNIRKALEHQTNFRDDRSDGSNATTVLKGPSEGEAINRLMVPVIANLRGYAEDSGPSYFNKFTKAPAWAIDGSVSGNKSFFGEDWGKPPSRVGRDPRYRPTFHEGRYTVFEPTDGRVSGGRGGRGGWNANYGWD
ncbi:MAG: hypothetical protein Q9207_003118 [Kuettlingeria erythrocarpa]